MSVSDALTRRRRDCWATSWPRGSSPGVSSPPGASRTTPRTQRTSLGVQTRAGRRSATSTSVGSRGRPPAADGRAVGQRPVRRWTARNSCRDGRTSGAVAAVVRRARPLRRRRGRVAVRPGRRPLPGRVQQRPGRRPPRSRRCRRRAGAETRDQHPLPARVRRGTRRGARGDTTRRLDTVIPVNSGSEATDLAWRLAQAATGHDGAIVTDRAYHGITEATTTLSPVVWDDGVAPITSRRSLRRSRRPAGAG